MEISDRHDTAQFVASHLWEFDEDKFAIIKGHLLAEAFLRRILETQMARKTIVDDANLTFFHVANLCCALDDDEERAWVWEVALLLNSLRNTVAHDLDLDSASAKLDAFLSATDPRILPDSEDRRRDLRKILFVYCGVLFNIHRELQEE